MRRFYVAPKSIWRAHVDLFHSRIGSHYVDLAGGMVLVSTDFDNPAAEEKWHLHPEVARLWNSTTEQSSKLSDLLLPAHARKQFTQAHLAALNSIGITGEHTVADVHRIASTLHPGCRLSSEY